MYPIGSILYVIESPSLSSVFQLNTLWVVEGYNGYKLRVNPYVGPEIGDFKIVYKYWKNDYFNANSIRFNLVFKDNQQLLHVLKE